MRTAMAEQKKGRWKWRLTAVAAVAVAGALLYLTWRYYPVIKGLMEPENMARFQEKLQSFGMLGVLALIGIQTVQVVSGVIPALPIQIAAGLTYGAFGGLFVCLAGIFIGSTIVFLVVKRYGQPVVDRMFPRKEQEKLSFLRDAGKLEKIVVSRALIPAMPQDVFTYLAALTPLDFKRFILISMAARAPMILCDTFASGTLIEGDYRKSIVIFCVAAAIGICGMIFSPKILQRLRDRKQK